MASIKASLMPKLHGRRTVSWTAILVHCQCIVDVLLMYCRCIVDVLSMYCRCMCCCNWKPRRQGFIDSGLSSSSHTRSIVSISLHWSRLAQCTPLWRPFAVPWYSWRWWHHMQSSIAPYHTLPLSNYHDMQGSTVTCFQLSLENIEGCELHCTVL